MVNIIKEKLPIEESLRKKLELICEFSKTTPKIINGNIRKIEKTNLTYIEPNRIIIKDKDNEISFLKSKISDLKNTIDYWKDKFEKLISFLHNKLHSWYDKDDKYIDIANNMYKDKDLDDDDIEELDLSKKNDFER